MGKRRATKNGVRVQKGGDVNMDGGGGGDKGGGGGNWTTAPSTSARAHRVTDTADGDAAANNDGIDPEVLARSGAGATGDSFRSGPAGYSSTYGGSSRMIMPKGKKTALRGVMKRKKMKQTRGAAYAERRAGKLKKDQHRANVKAEGKSLY